MRYPITPPVPAAPRAGHVGFWLVRWLAGLIAGCLLAASLKAKEAPPPPPVVKSTKDEFSSLVKLAPFVVNGKSLAISIFARTRSDRHYGEEFSEEVAKVIYEAVTESTGKGLVIIGAKGEPHPTVVFRKFVALAKDGKLDPEIATREAEVSAMLDKWEHSLSQAKAEKSEDHDKDADDLNIDVEKIFTALPLPLEGIGAKLYQLAWEEKFDDAKVEAALRALRPGDLERRDRFKAYDWVFYLPPKGVFDKVLDEIIAEALKKEEMGFFARTAVKGVLLVLKPKIRRIIEDMRQGLMFRTVLKAQTPYTEEEIWELTGAYIEANLPFQSKKERPPGKNDHERAVNSVRARLQKNAEKAKSAAAAAAATAATEAAAAETATPEAPKPEAAPVEAAASETAASETKKPESEK